MNNIITIIGYGIVLTILFIVSQNDYLLFHSLAEMFSIVIAFGIFVIGWNSKKYYHNNYLLFIGIAYLFVAFFDTLHTLSFKGMTVFPGFDGNNLSTQLWLVARYMESSTLLLAPFFINRPLKHWCVFTVYSVLSALALYSIFYALIFPVCFVTGSGLTTFKVVSEYSIDSILLGALYLLYKKREYFDPYVLKLLILSIVCTMITELCFTMYVDLYGVPNLVGHFFKIFSIYFMYKAIIKTALAEPYDLLFKDLQESEERFKALSEATFGGTIIHDNGLILECNKELSEMTGFSTEELHGMNGFELIAPESLDTVIANIRSGYDKGYEVEGVRKDGSRYPMTIRGKNVAYKGRDVRVIEFHDITEHKKAVEERNQLEQQLLQSQKMESLGVLAGGIAHDFNNILTVIIGNADLALMRTNLEPPVTENLHQIRQAATRAADLAKQMLDYSGKGQFIIEKIDLNRLVDEMLHLLQVSISKQAELRLNLTPNLPTIEADPAQIRQIIMSTVINASEAIGEKNGVITITTGYMECDHNYLKNMWFEENLTEGLYVFLEIEDTGCGIQPNVLPRVFDPFFSTKFTGRGLAMAAVLGIVRSHNGAIRVDSEPGKGTTIKIVMPASSGLSGGRRL